MEHTYLSQRGYAIDIRDEAQDLCDTLRRDLTVKPIVNPNLPLADGTNEFPVYRESTKKLYMPKSFGLQRFGAPITDQLHQGEDAPRLVFSGSLRPEQLPAVHAFVEAANDPSRMGGIISLGCGQGKCLGRGTPILMYDGAVKAVEDVVVGDLLLGDDCTHRTVLSTCTGREQMYMVAQPYGNKLIVNKSHIVSLYHTRERKIVDISVTDYLELPDREKAFLMAYKVPVRYSNDAFISKEAMFDQSMIHGTSSPLYKMGMDFGHVSTCIDVEETIQKARFVDRIHFMAGVLDAYATITDDDRFVIPFTHLAFFRHVKHIAGSVGFAVSESSMRDIILEATVTVLTALPLLNPSHFTRRFSWRNYVPEIAGVPELPKGAFYYHFSFVPLRENTYYGFEIDGNRRFVLGDCTVTHNTVIGLNLACVFKKKTLIICHKEFLMNQWRERIEQFIPAAHVGIIKQKKVETHDKDIVIASLQSLAMREYPPHVFREFGFVVIDECHHTGAEVFSRALFKVNARVTLGLSATLKRNDGLSKVFEWHIGTVVYSAKRAKDSNVNIYAIRYTNDDSRYGVERLMFRNRVNVAGMITDITVFQPRNDMILEKLEQLKAREPTRKVLVLSDRRGHLDTLKRMLEHHGGLGTVGYYVGGMKEAQLKESEGKDIILGTFQMASEGMDIPALDTLILASPISAIEQPVGRILRQKPHERRHVPTIIDIIDDYSLFSRQGKKRLAFYKKQHYTIVPLEPEDALSTKHQRRMMDSEVNPKEIVIPTNTCLIRTDDE